MAINYVPQPDNKNPHQDDQPSPIDVRRVLDVIYPPNGSTRLARETAQYHIHQHVISQLKHELIAPSRVKAFIYDVKRAYDRAQVRPGLPYGHGISEAYSSNTMQATLNTFHRAGSAQNTGFDEIRGILYLSPVRKVEEVYGHFMERLTPLEIHEVRKKLVEVKASSLVLKSLIEPYTALDNTDKWWYAPQLKANSIDTVVDESVTVILRLYLDTQRMMEYGISMAHLANKIIAIEDIPNCAISEPVNVHAIFSPMKDGIIDIVFNRNQAESFANASGIDIDTSFRIFYKRCFLPYLDNIIVSGVEGIERLVVSTSNVIDLVRSEEKTNEEGVYILHKNMINVNFSGVKDSELFDLLESVGCEILEDNEYSYVVKTPDPSEDLMTSSPSPLTLVRNIREGDENYNLKTHYYATITTNRLRYIIMQPEFDRDRTYCNNFFVMAAVFGLEVARLYHEYNSYQIMAGTGENTNSRYINAFSTVSSSRGMMSGITFAGLAKNAGGFLSIATIEQSGNVFAQQALFNKNGESLRSVSSAISVGTEPFVGTGAYPEEYMARRAMPRMEVEPILNVKHQEFFGVSGVGVQIDNAVKDSDITPLDIGDDAKSINRYVGGRTKLTKPPKIITTSISSIDNVGPVTPAASEKEDLLKVTPSLVTDEVIKDLVPPSPYEGDLPEILQDVVLKGEEEIGFIPDLPSIQFVANSVALPTIQLYAK
jgi:hypothetical protein